MSKGKVVYDSGTTRVWCSTQFLKEIKKIISSDICVRNSELVKSYLKK